MIFSSIYEVLDLLNDPGVESHSYWQGFRWIPTSRPSGKEVALLPAAVSPFLYRGQTKRYSPCLPSIVRGFGSAISELYNLSKKQQVQFIENYIRIEWFREALAQHPAMQWAKSELVYVNEIAVAQHYGIPTGYIDLTQSIHVAAFFATNSLKNDVWVPVEEGEGILYRLHWSDIGLLRAERALPIGLQPFPRPREQWAWTFEDTLGEDFEQFPQLDRFVFRHRRDASVRFHDQFHAGEDLFPQDAMKDLAESIMRSPEVPLNIARDVVKDLIKDKQGLPGKTVDDVLKDFNRLSTLKLVDSPPNLLTQDQLTDMRQIWDSGRKNFFDSVGWIFVREKLPPEETSP